MKFTFQNHIIAPQEIQKLLELDSTYEPIVIFVQNWVNGSDSFEFHTSGSTGSPKAIKISRSQIEASIKGTAKYLNLRSGENILLCLNPNYIAAIMMVARGLFLNMDVHITRPTSNPILEIKNTKVDFASFVPLQIYRMIKSGQLKELSGIKNVLIGGAPLSDDAFAKLAELGNNNFATYGMTETVSHIALMQISGDFLNATYTVLPNIQIGISTENCLWIKGSVTNNELIQTTDVVELLNPNEFKWLGRKDNVINSGGIKIHPEQIEKIIKVEFARLGIPNEFYVTGIKDENLGKRLVLMLEVDLQSPLRVTMSEESILSSISSIIEGKYSKYHVPKKILFQERFARTESGKVKRG